MSGYLVLLLFAYMFSRSFFKRLRLVNGHLLDSFSTASAANTVESGYHSWPSRVAELHTNTQLAKPAANDRAKPMGSDSVEQAHSRGSVQPS